MHSPGRKNRRTKAFSRMAGLILSIAITSHLVFTAQSGVIFSGLDIITEN
jgi:hypothetical protein